MQKTINPYPLAIKIHYKLSKDQQIVNSLKRTPKTRSPSNKENINPNNGNHWRKGAKPGNTEDQKPGSRWGLGQNIPEKSLSPKRCCPSEKNKIVNNKLLQIYLKNKSKSPSNSKGKLFLGQSTEYRNPLTNEQPRRRISPEKRDDYLQKYYSDYLRNKLSKKITSEGCKSQFLNKISTQNVQIPIEFSKITKSSYMDSDSSTNLTSIRNSNQFHINDSAFYLKNPVGKVGFDRFKDGNASKVCNSSVSKSKLAYKFAEIDEPMISKFYKPKLNMAKGLKSEDDKSKRQLNEMIRSCFNLSRIATDSLERETKKVECRKSRRNIFCNSPQSNKPKSTEPKRMKCHVNDKQLISKLSRLNKKLKVLEKPRYSSQKVIKTAEKGVQVDEWMVYNADVVKEANLIVNLDRMKGLLQREAQERNSSEDDPNTFFREIY